MPAIPSKVKETLKTYLNNLSKEINIASAILFGSYASGNQHQDSDIDLAVFSDKFSHSNPTPNIAFLLDRALPYDLDIQPLAFPKKDLDNYKDNPFLCEIVSKGIKLL